MTERYNQLLTKWWNIFDAAIHQKRAFTLLEVAELDRLRVEIATMENPSEPGPASHSVEIAPTAPSDIHSNY